MSLKLPSWKGLWEFAENLLTKANQAWDNFKTRVHELEANLASQEGKAKKQDFMNAVFSWANVWVLYFSQEFKVLQALKQSMKAKFVDNPEFSLKDLYIWVVTGKGYQENGTNKLKSEIIRIYLRDIEHNPYIDINAIDIAKMKRLFWDARELNEDLLKS